MRRTLPSLSIVALLVLAGCGSDDDVSQAADDATVEADEADAASDDETSDDETSDDGTTDDGTTDDDPASDDGTTDDSSGAANEAPTKPEVDIPDELPTELVRTVLIEGSGPEAQDGDTVVVDYVGVRSVDGVEFDNSYVRDPFPVTLGSGSVIAGWEQGLVGARPGDRIQLDIPSDLAYGETARSDVIRENEALTFVIDVRSVVTQVDPADVPTEPGVELSPEVLDETVYEDLVVGDGEEIEIGDTALIRYVNFRGDNGVVIEQNWTSDPLQVPYNESLLPGLLEGMEGMQVGGRRAITIPPEDGFGPEGNPQGGLPANTNMIFLIELLGVY